MSEQLRVAWITGASTGIGYATAHKLADDGWTVAVSARSQSDLERVADNHPLIVPFPMDVTVRQDVAETLNHIEDKLGVIDLAIFSAGLWCPLEAKNFDTDAFEQSMKVNYLGVVEPLGLLIPQMIARRRGHLAWVSSVAGYRGLPQAAAYGPTKAALINLAECLKEDLEKYGVKISIINPGFVATPMTAKNEFPMPFIITAERAAACIVEGIKKEKFEIAFPWQLVWPLKLARILPYRLFFWYVRNVISRS